jgi:hypothetical protein
MINIYLILVTTHGALPTYFILIFVSDGRTAFIANTHSVHHATFPSQHRTLSWNILSHQHLTFATIPKKSNDLNSRKCIEPSGCSKRSYFA